MSQAAGKGGRGTHLVLISSSFPYGTREEFLEDEVPIVADRFDQVTIVCEKVPGPARPLPERCRVVVVERSDAVPRGFLLQRTLRDLAEEWGTYPGLRRRGYVVRAVLYYHHRASAVVRAVRRSVGALAAPSQLCFYSYWLDYGALAAACLTALYPGSVGVSRVHGYDLYPDRHPHRYLPLRRSITRRLARVFAVSDTGVAELRRQVGSGVDVVAARLGVPRCRGGDLRPSVGGPLIVVSIGSLIPLKRVGLLLKALAGIEPGTGVSWRHFGEGPLRDGLRREAASCLRVPCRLDGYVPHSDLRELLHQLAGRAVLVSTSESEGLPVSMMEAMACGIPCIGTDVGGVREIVEDGANGYLLPPDPTPAEVRSAVLRYAALPEGERSQMRRAAGETWATRFDAAKNYSAFAAELLSLSGARGRRAASESSRFA